MRLPRCLRWRSARELDEEIAAHLDSAAQAGAERGLSAEEARYAALRQMGNVTRIKERAREGDPLFWIESIVKDVRYALRNLRRNPAFTAAAVLSLALGIGVNAAIFSFVDGMLLRPLDVRAPSEIVDLRAATPRYKFGRFGYREYAQYRDETHTLAGLVAGDTEFVTLQTSDDAQTRIAFGDFVSGNYFPVFGIQPAMGRLFLPEEDSPAAKELVAVLSAQGWANRFQSDPHILGRRIKINGQTVTIVGVLPERFIGTSYFMRLEIYMPLAARARVFTRNTGSQDADPPTLSLYGRLKPGARVRQAQAEFAVLGKQWLESFPDMERDRVVEVLPDLTARAEGDPDDVQVIYVLGAIAVIVLLVASINVANLLLGRATVRAKEMTVRQSVGASRVRLIVQMLVESAVLAGIGALVGVLLSSGVIHYFASIQISPDFLSSFPARLDVRVLLFAMIAAGAAVFASGLWPAIRATRVDLITSGKEALAGRGGRGRNVLVGLQTALSTMLLIAAALFVKSLILTSRANPGFRVDNVLTVTFDPALGGYTNAQARSFYSQVEERVGAISGVLSTAMGSSVPMGGSSSFNPLAPEGAEQNPILVMYDRVQPAYFETMGVPILRGRSFNEADQADTSSVAIVNQALAQRFWPNQDAIGQRVRFVQGKGARVLEVVGVAGNGKYQSSIDAFEPYIYLLNRQFANAQMTLFVHTAVEPGTFSAAIRDAVKKVDPNIPVYAMHTMREIFEGHGLFPARIMALMVGSMGAIGMTLGVLGLYAVTAFAVARRTREIGIRMALGATARSVLREVLASGAKITLAGIGLGLVGAFLLTRYFEQFLDHVSAHDPAAFAGVAVVLLAVAMAACWAPAQRASRVDPMVTLRYE